MPRHHNSSRYRREGRHWHELEPLPAPLLTRQQVQTKRLELIVELAELVITDAVDLPGATQRHLEGLTKTVTGLRRQL